MIKPNTYLTLHYRIAWLQQCQQIDIMNTFEYKPATLLLGAGQWAEPLEYLLLGMMVGKRQSFILTPEQAFGPIYPQLIKKIAYKQIPDGKAQHYIPGNFITIKDEGEQIQTGVIQAVDDQAILCNFNHPLAGKTLYFDALILSAL